MDNVKHMAAPCGACPFTRTSTPGALGGSSPEVYIGQTHAPFVLPCHCACNFDDPDWKSKAMTTPQCAGAAIFRANCGLSSIMPAVLHSLPPDTERVFTSPVEFLAHHKQISYMHALRQLGLDGVGQAVRAEFHKMGALVAANPAIAAARVKPVVPK